MNPRVLKRAILKVNITDDKEKKKSRLLKAVSTIKKVDSVSVDAEKGLMTVVGDMDVPELVMILRKKKWQVQLLALLPPEEEEYYYAQNPRITKYQPDHYGHYGYNPNFYSTQHQLPQYGNYYSTQLQPQYGYGGGYNVNSSYDYEDNPNSCVIS